MSLLMQQGLVSIIVPVFNQPQLMSETVHSLLKQSHRSIEIIIIDAGSTDETPVVLGELAASYSQIRPLSQLSKNTSVARELGRLNAKGEFIQYCDAGERLLLEKCARQVEALYQNPNSDVAHCHARSNNPVAVKHRVAQDSLAMFPSILKRRIWATATPLYRRRITDQAGPWLDVTYDAIWEYECRIASYGGRLTLVDYVGVGHYTAKDQATSEGMSDVDRLCHQCLVLAKIFRHAQTYAQRDDSPAAIALDDWRRYSESAFELGRKSGLQGLNAEARAMLTLSIEALGKKTPTHRFYLFLVKWFGWKKAAQMHTALPR